MSKTARIQRALLSVSDKSQIVELAKALHDRAVSLISTGGTAKLLGRHGIPVTDIETYTGFPELMDGRVKTLHPKVFAGLLARGKHDAQTLETHGIPNIDLLVVNLYPFVKTITAAQCTHEQAIENIDVGGPSMLRAAAKNYHQVCVLSSPDDYESFLQELSQQDGHITEATRLCYAQKVFARTQAYDAAISRYLAEQTEEKSTPTFPKELTLSYQKAQDLRYGENPHQTAALYVASGPAMTGSLAHCQQLQGKPCSYNNLADADTALNCAFSFENKTACVIVKHANPCGIALAETANDAYQQAFATDPTSAFGGIIAFNTTLDVDTAQAIIEQQFAEVIIAPQVTAAAQDRLQQKPNLRVLVCQARPEQTPIDLKAIAGGLLVQSSDHALITPRHWEIASKLKPTKAQERDLIFAWQTVKFVKSNAIVYAKDQTTLGIGAGQMSRIFSAEIALQKAAQAKLTIATSVMASDAFFPFKDSVELAAQHGVSAIIQPGGSKRDAQVIQAADDAGIVMVLTGLRHFRH